MTNKIDWNAPLEAYHPDGRVKDVEAKEDGGCYRVGPDCGGPYFAEDGQDGGFSSWRIRNRTEKPALTEEMVRFALSYWNADATVNLLREHGVLAEPVDADEVLAKEVWEQAKYSHDYGDSSEAIEIVLAAIKRVRAEKG